MRLVPARKRTRLIGVLGIIIGLLFGITGRLFVWPPTDSPVHVDVIVALAGNPPQLNAKKALSLSAEGYAHVAVLSLGGDPPAPCLKGPPKVTVVCFEPNPIDTRGEAEYVTRHELLKSSRRDHRARPRRRTNHPGGT